MTTLNLNRLVRSAFIDETYASYVITCLNKTEWSIDDLYNLWKSAKESDLTVSEFIEEQKENYNDV